jgi:DNA-binding transcriptional LysR family regulator
MVDDFAAIIDLAVADGGIAQCALHNALPQLREGSLRLLLIDSHDPGRREFVIVYPHRQFLAPRVRVVVDALFAHFQAATDLHLQPAELPAAFRAVASRRA